MRSNHGRVFAVQLERAAPRGTLWSMYAIPTTVISNFVILDTALSGVAFLVDMYSNLNYFNIVVSFS